MIDGHGLPLRKIALPLHPGSVAGQWLAQDSFPGQLETSTQGTFNNEKINRISGRCLVSFVMYHLGFIPHASSVYIWHPLNDSYTSCTYL